MRKALEPKQGVPDVQCATRGERHMKKSYKEHRVHPATRRGIRKTTAALGFPPSDPYPQHCTTVAGRTMCVWVGGGAGARHATFVAHLHTVVAHSGRHQDVQQAHNVGPAAQLREYAELTAATHVEEQGAPVAA